MNYRRLVTIWISVVVNIDYSVYAGVQDYIVHATMMNFQTKLWNMIPKLCILDAVWTLFRSMLFKALNWMDYYSLEYNLLKFSRLEVFSILFIFSLVCRVVFLFYAHTFCFIALIMAEKRKKVVFTLHYAADSWLLVTKLLQIKLDGNYGA